MCQSTQVSLVKTIRLHRWRPVKGSFSLGEICASKYQKKIDKSVQGSAGVAGGEGGEGGPPGQGSQVTCHLVLLPSPSSTSSSPLPPSLQGIASSAPLLKLTPWLAVLVVNLSRERQYSRGLGTLFLGDWSRNG